MIPTWGLVAPRTNGNSGGRAIRGVAPILKSAAMLLQRRSGVIESWHGTPWSAGALYRGNTRTAGLENL